MMYKALFTSMALALSGTALAADFQTLDVDGDGSISPAEAASDSYLTGVWSQADANNDGKVDEAEFSALEITDDEGGSELPGSSSPME